MGDSRSDRCLPGSEGSTLGLSGPVCELCGSASRTPSASESLLSTGPEFRAIPTCAPLWPTPDASVAQLGETAETWLPRMEILKAKHGNGNGHGMPLTMAAQLGPTWRIAQGLSCPCRCHTSMFSAVGSPAREPASPAAASDSPICARVFGQSTPVSLASYDPDTSSWKTSQLCLLGGSEPFSGTWPRSGMTRSGIAYQLAPLAPLTAGTVSGLLQPGPRRPGPSGNELGRAVNQAEWATPTAHPRTHTPRQVDHGQQLANQVGGSLNPTWVEWLMGFPTGWTDLEASGTP